MRKFRVWPAIISTVTTILLTCCLLTALIASFIAGIVIEKSAGVSAHGFEGWDNVFLLILFVMTVIGISFILGFLVVWGQRNNFVQASDGDVTNGEGDISTLAKKQSVFVDEEINIPALAEKLNVHFDKSELEQLCFELGIEYDNLRGDTMVLKAQKLVGYCKRRGRIMELIARARLHRPHVQWS